MIQEVNGLSIAKTLRIEDKMSKQALPLTGRTAEQMNRWQHFVSLHNRTAKQGSQGNRIKKHGSMQLIRAVHGGHSSIFTC